MKRKLFGFAAGFAALALAGVAVYFMPHERSADWMTDLEAAKARSAKEGKPLLIEFTGTTWCPPCIALEKRVFSSDEFAALSKSLVLVYLDYPVASGRTPEKVKANPELAKLMAIQDAYEVIGFPTVIVLDPAGKPLSKLVGYSGVGPSDYLPRLNVASKQ